MEGKRQTNHTDLQIHIGALHAVLCGYDCSNTSDETDFGPPVISIHWWIINVDDMQCLDIHRGQKVDGEWLNRKLLGLKGFRDVASSMQRLGVFK